MALSWLYRIFFLIRQHDRLEYSTCVCVRVICCVWFGFFVLFQTSILYFATSVDLFSIELRDVRSLCLVIATGMCQQLC